jgi:hypothetical protein
MTAIDDRLRNRVFESLDHARENGYTEFFGLPAQVVAEDLAEYDSDLEGEDTAILAKLVTEWRQAEAETERQARLVRSRDTELIETALGTKRLTQRDAPGCPAGVPGRLPLARGGRGHLGSAQGGTMIDMRRCTWCDIRTNATAYPMIYKYGQEFCSEQCANKWLWRRRAQRREGP